MRLIPLHNSLLLLRRAIGADALAVKLVPHEQPPWPPSEVAVGNLADLPANLWQDGQTPSPITPAVQSPVFGLPNLYHYQSASNVQLWRIDITDQLLKAMPNEFLISDQRTAAETHLGSLWLAATFEGAAARETSAMPLEEVLGVVAQTLWRLYRNAAVLVDPTTGLAGMAEFREQLKQRLTITDDQTTCTVLMLVGLRDYTDIRRKLGQVGLEQLLCHAARTLQDILRKTDELFCYREGQFAILATVQDRDAGTLLANKVTTQLNTEMAQEGVPAAERGLFAAGYQALPQQSADADDPDLICLQVEQTLDWARLSIEFNPTCGYSQMAQLSEKQKLPHSFPATDAVREHRNHRLLWQTASLCATPQPSIDLCCAFVDMLNEALIDHTAALFSADQGHLTSMTGAAEPMTRAQQDFIKRAISREQTLTHEDEHGGWLAAPMRRDARGTSDVVQGCLFMVAEGAFDAADHLFFQNLTDQLTRAIAYDGEQPTSISTSAHETNHGVHEIAESAVMQQVLDFVSRIAATDVSVLITGESGAGKEVMARTIHQQSLRQQAPFITVDCSAIAQTLIDSELFGRVKGAYTGADDASEGRIAQAHGGTLFLDEIGELPLDVQSKLLRFVQERELTPVGGTQTRRIDTRILCATNRNLLAEVEAGRFRRDLYYRLQVIEVSLPPLRARREDLPQLVDQLLNRLSHQLRQPNKKLTPAAWQKIYEYHWPGNIRELQNALTRALLTAADHGIDTNDIELGQEGWLAADLTSGASGSPTTPAPKTSLSDIAARGATALVDQTPPVNSTTDPWVVLSLIMRDQIQQLLAQQLAHAPIGRWLNDSLILTAYSYCNQVLRDTANLLGMAESTLRRQLTKAEQNQQNPLYVTSATWTEQQPAIVHALQQIFAANHQIEGLAHRIEQLLLQQIISVAPKRHAVGAALMGVTQATYLKRLHSHNINTRTERDEEQPLNANSGR